MNQTIISITEAKRCLHGIKGIAKLMSTSDDNDVAEAINMLCLNADECLGEVEEQIVCPDDR